MNIIEIFLIGVGLSMDAFAASIYKGLSIKVNFKRIIIVGLYFGLFQAIMPFIGYIIGKNISYLIRYDNIVSFLILFIIGIGMFKSNEDNINSSINFKEMLFLSIATSIDALSIGITFSLRDVNIFNSMIIIGMTTFILSMIGVKLGNILGIKYKKISNIIGGVILILIGFKILIFN